jgi:hypothetical protein
MDHILVCPFDINLLDKLKERVIVINTGDFDVIQYMNENVNKPFSLHAIKIQTEKPLSSLSFKKDWLNLPLSIYTPEFGKYKDLFDKLDLIRKLNIRIFLSSDNDSNFTGLKILSSLNISCGIFLNNKEEVNWNAVNDLMHYGVYTKTKHAPIDPFYYLLTHYLPTEYIDYNFVYFNNPTRYLHINNKEQIALTELDLMKGNYVAKGLKSLANITKNKKYLDFINARYDIMLQMNECAFCRVFRICLAKFQDLPDKHNTCKSFFSDFMDAADYYYSNKNDKGTRLWQ